MYAPVLSLPTVMLSRRSSYRLYFIYLAVVVAPLLPSPRHSSLFQRASSVVGTPPRLASACRQATHSLRGFALPRRSPLVHFVPAYHAAVIIGGLGVVSRWTYISFLRALAWASSMHLRATFNIFPSLDLIT